jgi:hypothetical protein
MTTHRDWSGSRNPFLGPTEDSILLSNTLFFHHDSALLQEKDNDPDILAMYTSFNPLQVDFNSRFSAFTSAVGARIAANTTLRTLLRDVSGVKIADWDVAIQNVYRRGTEAYVKILPHFRKPFQNGGYDVRLNHLNALVNSLDGIPALANVYNDVMATALLVKNARAKALGLAEDVRKKRQELEAARMSCCAGMFVNLGRLIAKYPDDSKSIDRFFDLKNLRNLSNIPDQIGSEYEVIIPANSVKECGFQIYDEMKLMVYNPGGIPLYIYTTSNSEDLNIPSGAKEILPDDEVELKIIDLGTPGARFMMIGNKNTTEEGEISFAVI